MRAAGRLFLDKVAVGAGCPCYIIAEIGSNHNRDLNTARKMIEIAQQAGCNAVKFQSYTAEGLYSVFTPRISEMEGRSKAAETPFELIQRIEMPVEWHKPLKDYSGRVGITFCSTPFDESMVDVLESVNVPFYKVASFEIAHYPMLKKIAATGKPVILSTGNSDLEDVRRAVDCLKNNGCENYALLHCVSRYPANYEDMNLLCLKTLQSEFGCPVGLSDHTTNNLSALVALGLGMSIIEKHFTLDKTYPGPDHPFALEPDELRRLVAEIRQAEAALGDGVKTMKPKETENHRIGQRSVIAAKDIRQGERITPDKLVIKRPSFGIHPKDMDSLIGKKVNKDIPADRWITWGDIAD